MRSSYVISLLICLIVGLWVASAIVFPPGSEIQNETEKKADSLFSVRVKALETDSVVEKLNITGRTKASRKTTLGAETTGQITQILVEKGAMVKEGDVLAKIEVKDRDSRVKEAKENVKRAEIEYNAAKLLSTKGFNSKIKLAGAKTELETARTLLKQAEIDLEKTQIKAPYGGILEEQNIEVGDFVSLGQPLFSIVDLDPIEAVAYIAEQHILRLKEGMPVSMVFLNDQKQEGIISFIAAAANDETRTFRIEISAENKDFFVKDGLTTEITIPLGTQEVHKISPSQLLLNDKGELGVFVVDQKGMVSFKLVDIIENGPDYTFIKKLQDSEHLRLVTVGQHFVKEGIKVNPVLSEKGGLL